MSDSTAKLKLYLEVTADTIDGDYISERSEISLENLEVFKPLIQLIKKKKGHNWATSEYENVKNSPENMYKGKIDINIIDDFMDYVPYGVHTITDIVLLEVIEETKLL